MKPNQLKRALFSLRAGVFVVMFMWTLDKFVNPGHAARVFSKFYLIEGIDVMSSYVIGGLQMLLVVGFFFGIKKRLTYGAIFLMHAVSTFSSYAMYMDPWEPRNLLFFAAWPMLAAIYTLYSLRDSDTMFTIRGAA